jgi:molecular chaperone GrpE
MTTSHKRSHTQTPAPEVTPPMLGENLAAETIPDLGPADPAPDIGALLKKAEDEAAELKDAWLRARADLDNVRKQAANDLARAHKYAIERFAGELLQVKDALESALNIGNATPEAMKAGVELTLKQLAAAFDKAQIAEINPAGAPFDPHQHQAMTLVDSAQPPNTVVQVFQKGYRLNDRVLRPALVSVAKIPDAQGAGQRLDPTAETPT